MTTNEHYKKSFTRATGQAAETTRLKACLCPYCFEVCTAVTGNGKPSPGDVAVCGYCLQVSLFDENLSRRKPTPEEAANLARYQPMIEAMRREMPRA